MCDRTTLRKRLADNLKAFNAKERDHLMRFAYMGQQGNYGESDGFLSGQFLDSLWETLTRGQVKEFPSDGACLFAGMDYHIDWLFAALRLTAAERDAHDVAGKWEVERDTCDEKKIGSSNKVRLDPILGNQEDLDLVILLSVESRLLLVLLEAKGHVAFDRVQLARKLIRTNNVITKAQMPEREPEGLQFFFVLASANEKPEDCENFTSLILPKGEGHIFSQWPEDEKALSFNRGVDDLLWMKIPGYPRKLARVERTKKQENGDYSHWKVATRHWKKPPSGS